MHKVIIYLYFKGCLQTLFHASCDLIDMDSACTTVLEHTLVKALKKIARLFKGQC